MKRLRHGMLRAVPTAAATDPLFAPHHRDGRFFCPWGAPRRTIGDLLRWRLARRPPRSPESAAIPRTENDGSALARVAERATRNYLAGNGPDLQADLAPGAHITTPDTRSRLLSIDETAWQTPDRQLAVLATTQLPDGTRIQTRLHLTVTRQTRWFITAINPQGTP